MNHNPPLKTFAAAIAFAVVCLLLFLSTLIATAAPNQPAVPSQPAATPPVLAVAISAGFNHRCALTTAGSVWCWGENFNGQLGNGSTETSYTPTLVVGLESGVTKVSTGMSFTCALQNGAAKCWGTGNDGVLGYGDLYDSAVPTDVVGLQSGILDIASTEGSSCAVDAEGKVWCWGNNSRGQLGSGWGDLYRSAVPIAVSAITTPVVGLAAGKDHMCAITEADDLLCWGANGAGQTGSGQETAVQLPPAIVPTLEGQVIAAAGGETQTCALTKAGGVKCWGSGEYNQLGTGDWGTHLSPVNVVGLQSDVTALSAATKIGCATQAGVVKCWGFNDVYARTGNGEEFGTVSTPTAVVSLTNNFIGVSNADRDTCAIDATGKVFCWGDNILGSLGTGTNTTPLTFPQSVIGFGEVISDSLLYLPAIKGGVTQ